LNFKPLYYKAQSKKHKMNQAIFVRSPSALGVLLFAKAPRPVLRGSPSFIFSGHLRLISRNKSSRVVKLTLHLFRGRG